MTLANKTGNDSDTINALSLTNNGTSRERYWGRQEKGEYSDRGRQKSGVHWEAKNSKEAVAHPYYFPD